MRCQQDKSTSRAMTVSARLLRACFIGPGTIRRVVQEIQVLDEAGLGLKLAWLSVSVEETV